MVTETVRTVAGSSLAVLEAGHGGRPLLLSHGFNGAKEDFGDWIEAFAAEGWWVVAPDLRGHGSSHQPTDEAAYSLDIFATDLLALADDLGWDAFSLVGHSMGGMVAQSLVLRAPDRVERLVLMGTHHGAVDVVDPETVALAVGVLRSEGLPALLALIDTLPAADKAPSEVRVRAERPGYVEFSDGKVHRCSGAMYAAMALELVHRTDRLDELARLTVPVLIVVGEEDRMMLPASRRMADAMGHAELVVIGDAAHSPQFENPQPWWDAVSTFLGRSLGEVRSPGEVRSLG